MKKLRKIHDKNSRKFHDLIIVIIIVIKHANILKLESSDLGFKNAVQYMCAYSTHLSVAQHILVYAILRLC